jgi:hypothetical protein
MSLYIVVFPLIPAESAGLPYVTDATTTPLASFSPNSFAISGVIEAQDIPRNG